MATAVRSSPMTTSWPLVLRQIARHGQDRRYHHIRVGVNSRLDTLQAAILLPKLAILEEEMQLRQQVAQMYAIALQAAGLAAPFIELHNRSAYAQFTIRIQNRSAVQTALKRSRYSHGCALSDSAEQAARS